MIACVPVACRKHLCCAKNFNLGPCFDLFNQLFALRPLTVKLLTNAANFYIFKCAHIYMYIYMYSSYKAFLVINLNKPSPYFDTASRRTFCCLSSILYPHITKLFLLFSNFLRIILTKLRFL